MAGFLHDFGRALGGYIIDVLPAVAAGFFISGLVHEFLPSDWIERNMGGRGLRGILYATMVGTVAPVCCWGSLPIAVSLHKRGASLGPVLALLVATPATSITALIMTWRFFGLHFAAYLAVSVIAMGIVIGLVGDLLRVSPREVEKEAPCPHCSAGACCAEHAPRGLGARLRSVLHYAYVEMPREIGVEMLIGIGLAAFVSVVTPVGTLMRNYLAGARAYVFAVVFGIVMYMCATMSVPLVDAFTRQGFARGAGMTLLLIGPVTSYGTVLVLRKQFGLKILLIYLGMLAVLAVLLGHVYTRLLPGVQM
jgi:uncharacterized membrane protein YraQ (UPF0718 family)